MKLKAIVTKVLERESGDSECHSQIKESTCRWLFSIQQRYGFQFLATTPWALMTFVRFCESGANHSSVYKISQLLQWTLQWRDLSAEVLPSQTQCNGWSQYFSIPSRVDTNMTAWFKPLISLYQSTCFMSGHRNSKMTIFNNQLACFICGRWYWNLLPGSPITSKIAKFTCLLAVPFYSCVY